MLKLENMFENFDLVREALAFWAHDDENLEEMLGYFRISSNAVYPFTAGRCVFCGWRRWMRRWKGISWESWSLSGICVGRGILL